MSTNIWEGSGASATPVQDTLIENFVATAGQTLFTFADIVYNIGFNDLRIFINGVRQIEGAAEAYVETSANSVTFTEGLEAGDKVQAIK